MPNQRQTLKPVPVSQTKGSGATKGNGATTTGAQASKKGPSNAALPAAGNPQTAGKPKRTIASVDVSPTLSERELQETFKKFLTSTNLHKNLK